MNQKYKVLKCLSKHQSPVSLDTLKAELSFDKHSKDILWSELNTLGELRYIDEFGNNTYGITFEGRDYLRHERATRCSFIITILAAIFGLVAAVAAIASLV